MLDFLMITTRADKRGVIECYPKFIIKKSNDLMIRGGDFYAIWDDERKLWSLDEDDAVRLIDAELEKYVKENRDKFDARIRPLYMWDAGSGMIDSWHKYCQRQLRDNFNMLDENLVFSNHETEKKDYATKLLPYPLEPGSIDAYDKIMSTLYEPEERHKIEWAIGAIVTGDSKTIQKFLVLYGSAGTGKSTVLNIIQKLFEGYYSVFDAKALGSSSNSFALEAFKSNPLVAIQHDGDLSRIEDNTRLNSLVSHELMTVNEKFKATYTSRFKCFLFMGTNKPVKITDAKSGLIRRLIDVTPTGNKLSSREYNRAIKQIDFELGAIAWHCKEVYLENPGFYDNYEPTSMMGATDHFYNFIIDSYYTFKEEDGTSLKDAWELYKTYCDDAKVAYPLTKIVFKEELKNYFEDYKDRFSMGDGTRARSYYVGFRTDKFEPTAQEEPVVEQPKPKLLHLEEMQSIFDIQCANCPAQYASDKGTPVTKWDDVTTTLSDIDTREIHYVKVPENHIVIDFDIPDENGNKCLEKNLEEASKWPRTYTELSKSGAGVHLHYIYTGDVTKLSRVYDDHIEIKVFTGKSSLRRKLTKCNNLPIANISSGLPLKGESKMVNAEVIKSEKSLRTLIKRNLNKEIHSSTKCSVDFIFKILNDVYNNGLIYDVTDMRNAVLLFAANSTNNADYCIKLVNKMKFRSEEQSQGAVNNEAPIVFYDIEVFPNLFLVNWKLAGDNPVIRMINPTRQEIDELMKYNLIGFNCRRYDNHLIYARSQGYNNEQCYNLSKRIINGDRNAFFGEGYNVSHTDVYDYSVDKKSLKKWEIELGIHHQELGLPWDEPVPEDKWLMVAEYCDNDVIATEAVHNHLKPDWAARQILADITDSSVNDTTNTLSQRFIFGNNRKPQDEFNYRNMGKLPEDEELFTFYDPFPNSYGVGVGETVSKETIDAEGIFEVFDKEGRPYFPGYVYEFGKSTYRGEEVGEGGYVYAEPGVHYNVALLDVASMHPTSAIAENLFGDRYTARFKELKDTRILIKHENWNAAREVFDGKLCKWIDKVIAGEISSKDLANALKIVINSVYGLTSANFDNPFRDNRNVDNIVAKRGALFMINLKHAVQERGFQVAHIKTDSIKIPNATPEIIQFVMEYGEAYGYTFEHEATYEKLCLITKADYVCKDTEGKWDATGAQLQVPYVFKKLFSREPIEFTDMCETKSVAKGDIYIDLNEGLPDVSEYEAELELRERIAKQAIPEFQTSYNNDGTLKERKTLEWRKLKEEFKSLTDEDLKAKIAEGHRYKFVGRVGQFCPIKEGRGGGTLYRYNDGKYYAVTGTKGYKWLESEVVDAIGLQDDIDRSYYDELVNSAAETISQYCDLEAFRN